MREGGKEEFDRGGFGRVHFLSLPLSSYRTIGKVNKELQKTLKVE